MTATRTIGNRLAPLRFIMFFALLFGGVGLGLAFLPRAQAIMIGFDVAATVFLVSCQSLFRHEASAMRKAASENDANRGVLLILTLILSLVILVTVAGELIGPRDPTIVEKLLVIVTLALSWTGANMVYALHYAHLFYSSDRDGKDLAGLVFPGDRPEPDYADFVYFAFTLGIALQTSDVAVTSPVIRRIVLLHCLEAFIFNMGVLALAISILAG
ncbi:MAG TPA: DUF1345 domain-containing protein [Sphingomicrobium sp.]|nr:DUF1345 domain-containing protein [Sphingomicrobium sp.]